MSEEEKAIYERAIAEFLPEVKNYVFDLDHVPAVSKASDDLTNIARKFLETNCA